MSREKEFEKVKKIIRENIKEAPFGIFNTRNLVGDAMHNIFQGEYFTIDICYDWGYYEVFGTNKEEYNILECLYRDLANNINFDDLW